MQPEHGIARFPDRSGHVDRDGVRLAYDVYGEGPTTVLLMPTWSIVHSRVWKAQVPFLSRHFRVVTFDGRGNGRSGRPRRRAAYADSAFADDTVAVMDATGTDRAVLVALSAGVPWAVHVAAGHPDRVLGVFAIGPACWSDVPNPYRQPTRWDGRGEPEGWAKHDKRYWLGGGYRDFREFFFGQVFSEPHSTKQIEDCVRWSGETTPEVLADTERRATAEAGEAFTDLCRRVRCPVHVLHGTEDHLRAPAEGQRLAELTGGTLTLLEGAGHGPMSREPILVNRLIREFAERVGPSPPPRRRRWVRPLDRRPRALYLSSPIGLGHARRDLAVVEELRLRHPGLEVDWLAQHPVTAVLEAAGERVHPASAWLASESGHIEALSDEHDLHAFQAIRQMDEILVNNFHVFDEVVTDGHYDLVVGDEAWDVDYFLHENPELKRFPFAWMTDFVGWLPMPDGGEAELALTADYNAEMIEQRARFRWVRDRSIFVGDAGDVVPTSFGPGLPGIREWTEQNFDFAGYITGFRPPDPAAVTALRRRHGYRPGDQVCLVTVGGSGVGGPLLRRVLDAVPLARRSVPELRFEVVTGPRIDPATLPCPRGVRVHGYLPRLHEHLAACDVAVVQGGLTTCMELTACGTPFVYVPLEHHFEQNFHVRHRLERYDAGRHLSYAEASDPDQLADAVVKELSVAPRFRPVDPDGAARAAALLAELL